MKIGVISDIHYPSRLKKLPDFDKLFKDVDLIFALGDYVLQDVIDLLLTTEKECYFVSGNMDKLDIQGKYPQKIFLRLLGKN